MKKISPEKPDILYVDDEQSNLEVFRISFKRGYNVWITTSPSEAFELLKNNPKKSIRVIPRYYPNYSYRLC
jgi:CheY-like chemotaxis protein